MRANWELCEGVNPRGAASLVKTISMVVETGRTEWLKNGAARGAAVNDLTRVDERGIRVSLRAGSIGERGLSQNVFN